MKFTCSQKGRCRVLLLVLLLLPLTTSCGSQAKGTVSGKVTYQGKPLPSGFVTFVPEKGAPVYSEIQSDGSYRVDQVPIGLVRIGIQPKSAQNTLASSAMPRNPQDVTKLKAAMTATETQIPSQYANPNSSGLTYTVTKGLQQYDIVLK
jgi:hypothetical protein